MKASVIIINLIIVTQVNHSLKLHHEDEFRADAVCVIQYDEDNTDEFLIIKDSRYYLTNQKQTSHFQINMPVPNINFFSCLKIDGKPPKEMIFQQFKDDTVWISIYSETKQILRFPSVIGKDIAPPKGWDGVLNDVALIDGNDDGYQDLLLSVNVAFDLRPRGIWLYDLKNKKELWHFWIGGSPRTLCVTDINGDDKDEIIISNTAVANGNVANGFQDNISYVIAFDRKGQVLWSREIGAVFSDAVCWVGDLENDGNIEVVVAECEGLASKTEPNQLLILNAKDGTTQKYIRSGDKYWGMAVCDINRDEKQEIVVGNTDGILRVYDHNLDLIMRNNINTRCKVHQAIDLDSDGTLELLVTTSENTLLILNDYLQESYRYISQEGTKIAFGCVSDNKKKKFLFQAGDKPPYLYTLMSVRGPNFVSMMLKTQSPLYIIMAILLMLAITYLIIRQRQLRKNLKIKQEHADRVLEWSGIAQRLAHEIKNPLSIINLTLQRIQEISKKQFGKDADVLDKYTSSILEEVERLRHTTDDFMKILSLEKPHSEPNDINCIINKVLEKYKTTLPRNIKIEKYLSNNLPLVRCDENQIIAVLRNIIQNAFEAIENRGIVTLRTTLNEHIDKKKIVKYIEIKIEDTGYGITKEHLKKIFTPFHSTKTGSRGIGLVIAKRIIEEHKGKIEIDSKEEIGTMVTIFLPVEG